MKKKNKKIKKVFLINSGCFKQECLVVINGEFKDAYNWFKRRGVYSMVEFIDKEKEFYFKSTEICVVGRLYTDLPKGFVMLIKDTSPKKTIGTIVHECLHLTHYITRKVGIELTYESEEVFTYLQEYLVDQILNKI